MPNNGLFLWIMAFMLTCLYIAWLHYNIAMLQGIIDNHTCFNEYLEKGTGYTFERLQ